MISKAKISTLIFASLFTCSIVAQDLHYSLFDMTPLNLNPATAGQFDGDYRFVGNHRHQWKSVTVPYTTFSVAADVNDFFKGKNFHTGIQINQDRAGDSRFNTFMINWSLAYSKYMNSDSSFVLTGAIMPGVANRSIDYTDLRFDNQYNGWTYDAALSNNESFQRESRTYFNLAAGIYGSYEVDQDKKFNGGFSLFNLTSPKQSFFNEDAIKLDTRWVFHGGADIMVTDKIDALPSFQIMGQGTYKEILFGSKVRYTLQDMRGVYRAVYGGIYYRNKDAGYIMAGLDYDNWKFGLSYDVNLSSLKPASNGRGALEFALIYILKIYNPEIVQRRICRDYM